MLTYRGIPVIESEECAVPRMTTSAEFNRLQTPELVASTQAWMRQFFGEDLNIYHLKAANTIIMHPRHAQVLRKQFGKGFMP